MRKYAIAFLAVGLLGAAPVPRSVSPRTGAALDHKLQQAFPGTEVSMAPIRIDLPGPGLVIAASAMSVEADGRIKFTDCAIAHFPGSEGGRAARPTAIRSAHAYFRLDRPAASLADLGDRKVLAVELAGGVRLLLERR
jgi:hypothetical protein